MTMCHVRSTVMADQLNALSSTHMSRSSSLTPEAVFEPALKE